MQTGIQDNICVLTPDYSILAPTASDNPCPQASELKCLDCDEAFHQADPWKRHIRACHQIPRLSEDDFKPLRNALNGRAICRYYHKEFLDI